MRGVLLTAAFLLLTALGAAADDTGPPKDAKDLSERLKLKRMREAILAEVREKQRKKLLAVYRGKPDFWKQRRLSGEGTAQVKLDRDGITCWIDRATGLIELLRTRYADGSGWSSAGGNRSKV